MLIYLIVGNVVKYITLLGQTIRKSGIFQTQ